MVMMLIAGAVIFGKFLAVTRIPFNIATWVGGLQYAALYDYCCRCRASILSADASWMPWPWSC